MKNLTETNFKITLAKRDKQADKKRHILDVDELMGAVYTEVSIAIYNIMTELAREIGPDLPSTTKTITYQEDRQIDIRNILQK